MLLQQAAASSRTIERSCEVLCEQLQATALCAAGETPLGRGLLMAGTLDARQAAVSVPIQNALVIADDPLNSISIFSDRHHRRWQEVWGQLPEPLLEFLEGSARWDVRMAAWLLWMRATAQPGSMWSRYLKLLPREPDLTCLLNYGPDERSQLQLPALQTEAATQHDWCTHLHKTFLATSGSDLAPLRLSSSLRTSLWALSMVRSRTFSEDVNGESLTLMCPFADLANHAFEQNSTFCLSKDNRSFQLRSLQPLAAGQEVTISYGCPKPNHELFRDYGFIVPGNPHDRIDFGASRVPQLNSLSLLEALKLQGDLLTGEFAPAEPSQGPAWERRRAALLSLPVKAPPAAAAGRGSGSSNSSSSGSGGGGGGGLFGWMDAACQPWTSASQAPPVPLKPAEVPAERAAVALLQQLLHAELAALPTSVETDKELLRGLDEAAGGPRLAVAVAARLEHKLLYRAAADSLQQYEAYLGSPMLLH